MNGYILIINPFAQLEIREAKNWYNLQKENLGDEFLYEIKNTIQRIQTKPFQFPLERREIRKAVLNKFPYSIFFFISESIINVFAVFHASRNPMLWKSRFKNK